MYIITLNDFPSDASERARQDAQERFRKTLEKALGGPENVLAAYRVWQMAEATSEDEMSGEDLSMLKKWVAATSRARNEGLRDLGETEAWFDIRVAKE